MEDFIGPDDDEDHELITINSAIAVNDLVENIPEDSFTLIYIPGFNVVDDYIKLIHLGQGRYRLEGITSRILPAQRSLWVSITRNPSNPYFSAYTTSNSDDIKNVLNMLVNASAPVTGGIKRRRRRNRKSKGRRSKNRKSKRMY
jgi:hypothetical protein